MIPGGHKGGTLYIVSTPIGNLGDLSPRAVDILKSVDLIALEDTRTCGRLLSHFDIKTPRTSFHDHNERSKTPKLIEALFEGKSVALISEAGTPLISDPGFSLVRSAVDRGIDVIPVPGPSSLLAALVASGFPTDRFCFEGYPPRTESKLRRFFEGLALEPRTLIFFESPHRIKKCLKAMMAEMGDRDLLLARELTKKFEEKIRGRTSEVAELIEDRTLKGEIVLVVRGYRDI
jgi:16S rRNA (cytidine1402-2'-O)-methyltransferase